MSMCVCVYIQYMCEPDKQTCYRESISAFHKRPSLCVSESQTKLHELYTAVWCEDLAKRICPVSEFPATVLLDQQNEVTGWVPAQCVHSLTSWPSKPDLRWIETLHMHWYIYLHAFIHTWQHTYTISAIPGRPLTDWEEGVMPPSATLQPFNWGRSHKIFG